MLVPRYPDDPVRVSDVELKRMAETKAPGSWLGQFKYDGHRCVCSFDEGRWKFYAKRSKARAERDHQPPDSLVAEMSKIVVPEGTVFDAEWMGPRDIKGILKGRHYFVLFDVMYHDGSWLGDQRFDKRLETLNALVKPSELVQVAETRAAGWDKMFEESKENWLTEGIVLREADSILKGDIKAAQKNPFILKVKWRDIHEATNY